MIVQESLDYSNPVAVEKGASISRLLKEISALTGITLKGSVVVHFESVSEFKKKFPKFKAIMDNYHVKGLEVVLSVVKSGEFKHLVRLKQILSEHGIEADFDYDRKKMIIYYTEAEEHLNGMIKLFDEGILDKLEKVYHWEVKINESVPDEKTVKLDKRPYTHVVFRRKSERGFIRVNKHFSLINNGKYTYSIDIGKIGEQIYRPDSLDFALLTHNHVDHVGSLLHKDNEFLKPIVITNLPTVELILSKSYDFPVRSDLRELIIDAYVNSKVFLGDTMVTNNIYSGHAYGTMFYIEDYLLGVAMLYMSDINPTSKAFKITNLRALAKESPDILAIEFPVYPRPRTFIPDSGIIGTTSGEYEEVLTLLPKGSRIMIDENSNITAFEVVRRKFKSFLTRRAREVRVSVGSIEEYLDGACDYFITTKGLAVSYHLNNGVKAFITNSKPTVKSVGIMKVKTHPTLSEVEEIIRLINPKILIIHHYNGNIRKVSTLMSFIERETDVKKVYTTPAEGHFLELWKRV